MRIGIIGYGKMGKAIEAVCLQRNHSIVFRSDSTAPFDDVDLQKCDVAIEFTTPESAVKNILKCLECGTAVVSGSTGWFQRLDEVKSECTNRNGTFFYSSNFSLGMNITFLMSRKLAELMNRFPNYEPLIEEIHHIHKKDSPSGTAITLAEDLIHALQAKTEWKEGIESGPETIGIKTQRIGEIPGTHLVSYTSSVDRITLSHEAFSRDGFALGAVLAAEFCHQRSGIFTMKDLLQP